MDDFQSKFQAIFTNISIFIHFFYIFMTDSKFHQFFPILQNFPPRKKRFHSFRLSSVVRKPVHSSNMGLLWLISNLCIWRATWWIYGHSIQMCSLNLGRNSDLFVLTDDHIKNFSSWNKFANATSVNRCKCFNADVIARIKARRNTCEQIPVSKGFLIKINLWNCTYLIGKSLFLFQKAVKFSN